MPTGMRSTEHSVCLHVGKILEGIKSDLYGPDLQFRDFATRVENQKFLAQILLAINFLLQLQFTTVMNLLFTLFTHLLSSELLRKEDSLNSILVLFSPFCKVEYKTEASEVTDLLYLFPYERKVIKSSSAPLPSIFLSLLTDSIKQHLCNR